MKQAHKCDRVKSYQIDIKDIYVYDAEIVLCWVGVMNV
jgi:hypothetical protein